MNWYLKNLLNLVQNWLVKLHLMESEQVSLQNRNV